VKAIYDGCAALRDFPTVAAFVAKDQTYQLTPSQIP
jgi:hypothetical protein